MRWRHRPLLSGLLCAALLMSSATAGAQPVKGLRSFYVTNGVWGGHDIASAEQIGDDVRLRVIRVAVADEHCHGLLVRAVERTLSHTTVQTVAGTAICAMSNRRIERALEAAPSDWHGIDFIGSLDIVVAACGPAEKVFVFRQPPIVDRQTLRRTDRKVDELWDAGDRLRAFVMGQVWLRGRWPIEPVDPFEPRTPFKAPTPRELTAQEALGTALLPELVAGKYQTALSGQRCVANEKETACVPNYLAWQLRDYKGPPAQRGPLPAELVERESLHLVKYIAPTMPSIAVSARAFGDVRLRISADPRTGLVTIVEPLSGSPLHLPSAIDAARKWQFHPESTPTEPVEVTLRFQLQCPAS